MVYYRYGEFSLDAVRSLGKCMLMAHGNLSLSQSLDKEVYPPG
jgi:hypothetical protein